MIPLQAVIRRALSESGCPPHIIDQLMENAHERRWPPGLSTLETRQVVCTREKFFMACSCVCVCVYVDVLIFRFFFFSKVLHILESIFVFSQREISYSFA